VSLLEDDPLASRPGEPSHAEKGATHDLNRRVRDSEKAESRGIDRRVDQDSVGLQDPTHVTAETCADEQHRGYKTRSTPLKNQKQHEGIISDTSRSTQRTLP